MALSKLRTKNKLRTKKKSIIQLTLLLAGLLIIFFTYFDLNKNIDLGEGKKTKDIEIDKTQEEPGNTFENVEYKGLDANGNRYVIASETADFKTESPEMINMYDVKCVFYFKDNTTLSVTADSGLYNNITHDMKFENSVRMNYLENFLLAERAEFRNSENLLLIENNIEVESENGNLRADRMDFNLNTKKLKISMVNNEKVNIKVNF